MRHSFISVESDSDFPLQNLPFGVFRRSGESPRVGVRIGEYVLDMAETVACLSDLLAGVMETNEAEVVFKSASLNAFMALGRPVWRGVRSAVTELLAEDGSFEQLRNDTNLQQKLLVEVETVEMCLPAEIGDYTDFYASKQHATNVGEL